MYDLIPPRTHPLFVKCGVCVCVCVVLGLGAFHGRESGREEMDADSFAFPPSFPCSLRGGQPSSMVCRWGLHWNSNFFCEDLTCYLLREFAVEVGLLEAV